MLTCGLLLVAKSALANPTEPDFYKGEPVYISYTPVFHTNPLVPSNELNLAAFIRNPKIYYRFRYLDNRYWPEDGSWKQADVYKQTGVSDRLDIPTNALGDVEFFFVHENHAPYYKYVDYSGKGLELELEKMGIDEKVSVVTSRCEKIKIETQGRDWFVRVSDKTGKHRGVRATPR